MKDYKPRNHLKYMGSKTVYAKEIAWHIRDAHPGGEFVEVFHGGGAITAQLKPRVAYDGNPCLKSFFDHIKTNPVLRPMEKPEWLRHKEELNQNDPRMAFAAFGNSFMGVSFNCFEQNSFDHTPLSNGIQKTEFVTADFKDLDFEGKVIYCDPPYKSTHGYNARGGGGLEKFNFDEFDAWLARISRKNHVYVSEKRLIDGFSVALELKRKAKSGFVAGMNTLTQEILQYKGPQ